MNPKVQQPPGLEPAKPVKLEGQPAAAKAEEGDQNMDKEEAEAPLDEKIANLKADIKYMKQLVTPQLKGPVAVRRG